MAIGILAVLALAWWLNRKGVLLPNLIRFGGVAAAGLLAVRFLTSGRIVMAAVAAAAGGAWWLWHQRDGDDMSELGDAARLLGVPPDAPSDVVWQAWRQAMTTAHPDAGGTAQAAQALTDARDMLVAAAEKRRDSDD